MIRDLGYKLSDGDVLTERDALRAETESELWLRFGEQASHHVFTREWHAPRTPVHRPFHSRRASGQNGRQNVIL